MSMSEVEADVDYISTHQSGINTHESHRPFSFSFLHVSLFLSYTSLSFTLLSVSCLLSQTLLVHTEPVEEAACLYNTFLYLHWSAFKLISDYPPLGCCLIASPSDLSGEIRLFE